MLFYKLYIYQYLMLFYIISVSIIYTSIYIIYIILNVIHLSIAQYYYVYDDAKYYLFNYPKVFLL